MHVKIIEVCFKKIINMEFLSSFLAGISVAIGIEFVRFTAIF